MSTRLLRAAVSQSRHRPAPGHRRASATTRRWRTCWSARTPGSCSSARTACGCTRRCCTPAAGCPSAAASGAGRTSARCGGVLSRALADGVPAPPHVQARLARALAGGPRRRCWPRSTGGPRRREQSLERVLAERAAGGAGADRRPASTSSPHTLRRKLAERGRRRRAGAVQPGRGSRRAATSSRSTAATGGRGQERLDQLAARARTRAGRRSRAATPTRSRTASRSRSCSWCRDGRPCDDGACDEGVPRPPTAVRSSTETGSRWSRSPARSCPCRCCGETWPTLDAARRGRARDTLRRAHGAWRADADRRAARLDRATCWATCSAGATICVHRRRRTSTALGGRPVAEHDTTVSAVVRAASSPSPDARARSSPTRRAAARPGLSDPGQQPDGPRRRARRGRRPRSTGSPSCAATTTSSSAWSPTAAGGRWSGRRAAASRRPRCSTPWPGRRQPTATWCGRSARCWAAAGSSACPTTSACPALLRAQPGQPGGHHRGPRRAGPPGRRAAGRRDRPGRRPRSAAATRPAQRRPRTRSTAARSR